MVDWEGKRAPSSVGVADRNPAPMGAADFFCDGKPQAKVPFLAAGRVGAVKPAKDVPFLCIRDPNPRINHLDTAFCAEAEQP